MAFDINNLNPVDNLTSRGKSPVEYTYWNQNTDTVTAAGYFVNLAFAVNDIIRVYAANSAKISFYRITAVSDGSSGTVAGTATIALIGDIPAPSSGT
ncbi:hypothetical protein NO1_0274 [Candidatus Termititenax aidoneus]|uniref:Uncharacterized protein n=1 Tax=Termititenax aidoneus TaxID=2218524 RepID=A0A388T998_TERA1|nr:hypothetical protein NO1_0274 [Candidatus Termititenax aidoneus]